MRASRRAGEVRPAGWLLLAVIGALILLVAGFPLLFPRGIRTGGPAPHEGLFVVRDRDWAHATFDSRAALEENERLRVKGMMRVSDTCLNTSAVRPELERALAEAQLDRFGGRAIWLRMEATSQFGILACIRRHSYQRGQRYGTFYRVTALREVRPLPLWFDDVHPQQAPLPDASAAPEAVTPR